MTLNVYESRSWIAISGGQYSSWVRLERIRRIDACKTTTHVHLTNMLRCVIIEKSLVGSTLSNE